MKRKLSKMINLALKSTAEAIFLFLNPVTVYLDYRQRTAGIFFDFSKTFDTVA